MRFCEYGRPLRLAARSLISELPGPIAGFVVAVPLIAYAIAISKIVPGIQESSDIIFGKPLLMHIFIGMFHPGADPTSILLHPVGRAAWFGLFATALNLLPVWQLDGGHILYSLVSKKHKEISLAVSLALVGAGNLLLARLGAMGNRVAGAVVALPASAGV